VDAVTDADRWTAHALGRLANAGYHRGGARQQLLTLMGEQRCALSALELEDALARSDRRVSRASIYRILEELEAVDVVQRVEVGAGITRYEPVRRGRGHHHHLVCEKCGRVEPFSDEGLERAIARVSERVPLTVSEHEVLLRGACEACAA
jgi:Fur family transcriptional regulator, ferric uptake regulator